MEPKNPLNDKYVDGNTIAWMQEQDNKEESCGCSGCGCKD